MNDALGELLKNHPQIYLYVVGGGGLLFLISAKLPIFGENIGKFLSGLRRAARNKDDADIAELRRQVDNLSAASERSHEVLEDHAEWDRNVYRVVQILLSERAPDAEPKVEIRLPPPLF